MKYEEAIKEVGECGRFQICILNLLYMATIFDGLQAGSMVFIVPESKHRCAIPDLANDTYEVQSEAHAQLIKNYIPEKMVDGKPVYSKCHLYTNESVLGNATLSNCTSWVYDKSVTQTSLTSDFNLVCGREWISKQVYGVFFAGYLVAMLSCGWLSDRFGRKTVIIAALLLQGVTGVLSSVIKDIYAILVLRFLTAIGGSGSYIPSVVYGAEISSVKNRTKASIIIQMYFTCGLFILTFLAYTMRNWTLLVLLISIPSIPTALFYIWALPESPRWLLNHKKNREAEIVLNKIARVNKSDIKFKPGTVEISVVEDRTVRLWKIFTIPRLLKRTLLMVFSWSVVSFVYYGLMLNIEHLSGNIYLNFFFGALVEIPAYITCILLLNRVGRKKLYVAFMLTGGLSGIMTIFPFIYASDDFAWTITALAILNKLCVTGTFGIIFLHTCELYPTCVRNGALGAHSTFARFGGITAPYIMMMRSLAEGKLGDSLPLMTMGFLSILTCVSYCFLPETSNRPMDDTFEDVCREKEPISENDDHELEDRIVLNPSA